MRVLTRLGQTRAARPPCSCFAQPENSAPATTADGPPVAAAFLYDHVLVGMTGSISVALMPQALLVLRQVAAEVHILMSRVAARFLPPTTVRCYSGQPVWTDDDEAGESFVAHIELTGRADVFLVMPATANTLAKAAHGICDDLVSTAVVAATRPVVFVPSMNEAMWQNPAIEDAVSLLRARGHEVIEPAIGREIGDLSKTFGVMPGIEAVLAHLVGCVRRPPRR